MKGFNSGINFPVVDFKFQNTGSGTAVLWQYTVEVLSAEIDVTPEMKFRFSVDGQRYGWHKARAGRLEVLAQNNGWGAALDCEMRIKNELLGEFFGDDACSFKGTVASGENKSVLILPKGEMPNDKFLTWRKQKYDQAKRDFLSALDQETTRLIKQEEAPFIISRFHNEPKRDLWTEWRKPNRTSNPFLRQLVQTALTSSFEGSWRLEDSFHEDFDATTRRFSGAENEVVRIDDLPVTWQCKDEKGHGHSGEDSLIEGGEQIFLGPSGFLYCFDPLCGAAMPPGPTFCTIIDPSRGRHERIYPVSRQIPAGDVERFQILVGANKSCSLVLRFRFAIDKDKVIVSDEFNFQIWNPRDSMFERDYQDGGEIEETSNDQRSRSCHRNYVPVADADALLKIG